MLELVGWTLPDLWTALGNLDRRAENRPSQFRGCTVGEGAVATRLESDGWLLAGGRLNLKYTRIQSRSFDIATVMLYPTADPALLPIFAAEWVIVGERAHALILDVETAGDWPNLQTDLARYFSDMGPRWHPVFPANPDRPAWFQEIAQPWAIFSSGTVDQLGLLREAYQDYARVAIEQVYRPRLEQAQAGPDHPAVTAYKQHHYEHSPGRRLLTTRFGHDYTETLLQNWHFGPAPQILEPL